MKLVMLIDGSRENFEEMIDVVDDKLSFFVDTENCNEVNEYRYLFNSIQDFEQSKKEVMLAKFSGKESIAKNLGEEFSEMILTLSDDKKSRYYTEYPIDMFLSLIQIFDKETT